MKEQLDFLGWKVTDKVTGFEGIVTHVGQDLYGCVQALVQPPVVKEKDGSQKYENQNWFDVSRLSKIGKQPAMNPIPLKGDKIVAGNDCMKPVK